MQKIKSYLSDTEKIRNQSDLKSYYSENIEKVLNLLPDLISTDRINLNNLFVGLSDPSNLENKIKVIDIVLDVLRKKPKKLHHCGNIINRVCLELPHVPSHALVRWCNDSVKSITDDTDVNMIWRDIVLECLNVIRSMDTVSNNNCTQRSADYVALTLATLLDGDWKPNQLVQLTAMFKDIGFGRQDRRKCVIKICSFIIDMSPDSLPPLAHQLLKFCKSQDVEVVLAHLSHYFNLHLYGRKVALTQDSEATTMDLDDIDKEPFSAAEVYKCLSTCIFHALGAPDPAVLRRQLKAWPRSLLTREPFVLCLALALLVNGAEYKSVCLEVLRSAVEQTVADEFGRAESAWLRRALPAHPGLDDTLKELATGGDNLLTSIWPGLIHMGFALARVPRGREARECAAHGARLLARLARMHPCNVPSILNVLADALVVDSTNVHYIECLRQLCKDGALLMNGRIYLKNILENCKPSAGAAAVIDAMHPLFNYNEMLRDTLVLTRRKDLYSSDPARRRLAVSAILTLIKHLRMSGGVATSTQDSDEYASQSSQSYMSVVSVDVHASQTGTNVSSHVNNDTVCHDMVFLLRRCLGQDASVKELLYSHWYWSVKSKPGLHNTLLEMLDEHLCKYLPDEDDQEFTLLIDQCVSVRQIDAVLIEPIGHLLYLIAQLLQSAPEDDLERILATQEQEENLPRKKLKKIMADLSKCNLLAQIDMENLNTSELTVECRASYIKVQQLLQVYEALVAHHVMQWSAEDGRAADVYRLYKEYTQLLDNAKSPSKASKKASKLNETAESTNSRRSQASGRSQRATGGKRPLRRVTNNAKDKNPFKPLPCLWDLKVCYRILQLLYSPGVSWSSAEQRESMSGRGVLHRWAARCVCAALQRCHERAHALTYVPRIAALLYERCLARFQNLLDFDEETTLGCLEMFGVCLNVLASPSYHCEPAEYLSTITTENSASALSKKMLLNQLRTILMTIDAPPSQGADVFANKRMHKTVSELIVIVLNIPTDLHLDLSKEIKQLERHVRGSNQDCSALVPALLAAAAAESCETALLDDLLAKLAQVSASDEATQAEETQSSQTAAELKWVQAGAVGPLGVVAAGHVLFRLGWARHTATRARDLAAALLLAVRADRHRLQRELQEARSSCVLQLCQVARAVRSLCALRAAAGGTARREMQLATRLYRLAADFLATVDLAAAESAGLKNLLTLMGDPLTLALRQLLGQLHDRAIPRLVNVVATFRTSVLHLDRDGQYDYAKYVSERIAIGMRIRTNEADGGEDSEDEAGGGEDSKDEAGGGEDSEDEAGGEEVPQEEAAEARDPDETRESNDEVSDSDSEDTIILYG